MKRMAKQIIVIPAKQVRINSTKNEEVSSKVKVAAYCRVSTDQEEQLNSFENQKEYYTRYIKSKPMYEMVGIYADEGISGTSVKKRKGFQKMIADCENGMIDLIIVKSISRFARNTQDCLKYSRKLKNLGIGIIFEKENINTLEASGELLFTILSSLAQDESRNISENCKWGIRSKFQEGKPHINTYKFMGYDKNEDGRLIINEEQAKIVKRIFKEFLEGYNPADIARRLNEDGIPGVSGEAKWIKPTIVGMLKQEKYMGDSLLQKWVTTDFLNHTLKKNTGQVTQYYVENSHPAIIDKDTWDAVQEELERRNVYCQNYHLSMYAYRADKNPLNGKIICGHCGYTFARKSWANRGIAYWTCKSDSCKGNIKEEILNKAFITAWNHTVENRERFMERWNQDLKGDKSLERIRAKQMIELTNEGTVNTLIPELVRMVLEKITVHDLKHFTVSFLDGTEKEILV
jgi:DNA invertase Pin-like site-specific DNA recombinase